MPYTLKSDFKPSGDQPEAIQQLVDGIKRGEKYQTLLGVTGSGKTFTISNVIAQFNKPVLVMSHNKTLAAQLYGEFKQFFPKNRVEYFISYYDYYQPEAYVPQTDTFIEKDASINDEIDRLRLRATSALMSGDKNVIIVASVSCIYGLGSPEEWMSQLVEIRKGARIERNRLLRKLLDIHYLRNDFEFERGTFRVRGDVIEIFPGYEQTEALRVEMFDDIIEKMTYINPLTGEILGETDFEVIYPAKQFVTSRETIEKALPRIKAELNEQLNDLRSRGKLLEAQRIEQRTRFDMEMMREVGYCSGIENYSRHISGRPPGSRPFCLLDYFPDKPDGSGKDYITIVDESHVTVPQIGGMSHGDRARKTTLVEYGFRLPSALDNRPLTFTEWEGMIDQIIFVSATPGDYEFKKLGGVFVEQVIRPTGLIDPGVEVRPIKNQIDNLLAEIRGRVKSKERVLVTTLTKRMAEDLTEYLANLGVKVRYIHSEVDALSRVETLRDLRLGDFDVLVGVNLLREGLDFPEVSLVAILDADKEGFLRSETSLIQTAGRTARNVNGKVILYADKITGSMQRMISETDRRRRKQIEYNKKYNITPKTIYKTTEEIMASTAVADVKAAKDEKLDRAKILVAEKLTRYLTKDQRNDLIEELKKEMKTAAKDLEFEHAAQLRDEIERLEKLK
ncbi:MAG: excinuclease ABC subunit UvrB [Bacteroidetes bacterium]|nr:excinuclease ABC subunit UvrB [Bacteroidota bacterium]MBU1422379.1 excinuclease ABC subunit UvrB [Bacteroidota bacterium]MBU2636975.1 excinuclease ABC subunit UvrB [Bacteroidota bacterium]